MHRRRVVARRILWQELLRGQRVRIDGKVATAAEEPLLRGQSIVFKLLLLFGLGLFVTDEAHGGITTQTLMLLHTAPLLVSQ